MRSMDEESPRIVAVALDGGHNFSKRVQSQIRLLEGLGVEGDAHCGETVKHRSRVVVDPDQPNLRQVHLLASELLDELAGKGFAVEATELGENVTTRGIALAELPVGTRLSLGAEAVVELTGLRNPCSQIEAFRPGLLAQVVGKLPTGEIERRAGVMAVVVRGGVVQPGDAIGAQLPPKPHTALKPV